ncbi:DsbA family protein [Amycolatopsis sp. NPDC059021]|uniref:DsbA family protein n=1 Tax=Amycolatopsis sp. NPDC059021 TaxID=3346704 RepID=UPI00366B6DA8
MGGAERGARKRRQQAQAARAVAQARGASGDRRKVIVTVVAIVVVAVAVIGGVIWINASKNTTEKQAINPGTSSAPATPPVAGVVEKRDGVVVQTGKPDAKASIDVYADFLCPICGEFQKAYGQQIEQAVNSGQLLVRYHMVPLLNKNSDPPGYSLDSANASLAAADAGKFTAYHDALFKNQPEEGGRGYDKGQLIKLGQDLGITDPKFADAINSGAYNQPLNDAFQQTLKDPNLEQSFPGGKKGFGTPTVLAGGKIVNWQQQGWLQQALAG